MSKHVIELMIEQGRHREAGDLLVRDRRFAEAGACYLNALPAAETPVDQLDDDQRRVAFSAAVCFERCGRHDRAVGLFANLGEADRAAALLKRLGRREDAALAQRRLPVPGNPWRPGYLNALAEDPVAIETADFAMTVEDDSFDVSPDATGSDSFDIEVSEDVSGSGNWLSARTSSESWHLRTDEQNREVAKELAHKSEELGLGPLRPGAVIANRFRIDGPLGEGGYAVVFRATDLELEEPTALKLFKGEQRDPKAVGRFKQEMRIARRLAHPSIVTTHEFGTWKGAYFLTMELMRGTDLEAFTVAAGGTLEPHLAVHLVDQAFAGLGHAHDQDVVHRDIKPRNLFVLEDGLTLKVMDFGIAKTTQDTANWTKTGRVVGTPCYIPPERLRRGQKGVTIATDLYAMGIVLFRVLTGSLPFDDRDIATLFHRVLTEPAPRMSDYVPDVPAALDDIVDRLLAKKPQDRYPTAAVVRDALQNALSDPW